MTASSPEEFEALRDFAYHVAHDLQEPVRAITGFTSLLDEHLRSGPLDEKTKEYLAFVRRAGDRLATMINRLVEYSRVLGTEPQLSAFDVVQLVSSVIDALDPELREAIDEIALPTESAVVLADPGLTRRCVTEIVRNVAMHRDDARAQELTVSIERHEATIAVLFADSGAGLTEAQRRRAAGMFERAHPRGDLATHGVGLTLAAAAATRQGGELSLSSNERHGLTVRLEIPTAAHSSA